MLTTMKFICCQVYCPNCKPVLWDVYYHEFKAEQKSARSLINWSIQESADVNFLVEPGSVINAFNAAA